MIHPENIKRAKRANDALRTYIENKGELFDENRDVSQIIDLIADLLHIATTISDDDYTPEVLLHIARNHYLEEIAIPDL